jgi:hypothetical protein
MADKNLEISFANISASTNYSNISANTSITNTIAGTPNSILTTNVYSNNILATSSTPSLLAGDSGYGTIAESNSSDININISGVNFGNPAIPGLYKRNETPVITLSTVQTLLTFNRLYNSYYLSSSTVAKSTNKLRDSIAIPNSVLASKGINSVKVSQSTVLTTPLKLLQKGVIFSGYLPISSNTKNINAIKFSTVPIISFIDTKSFNKSISSNVPNLSILFVLLATNLSSITQAISFRSINTNLARTSNNILVGSSLFNEPNKGVLSSITSASNILNYQAAKTVQDFIYPTDDVLGDANIDDDQTAWVNKSLISIVPSISTHTYSFSALKNSVILSNSTLFKTSNISTSSTILSNSNISLINILRQIFPTSTSNTLVTRFSLVGLLKGSATPSVDSTVFNTGKSVSSIQSIISVLVVKDISLLKLSLTPTNSNALKLVSRLSSSNSTQLSTNIKTNTKLTGSPTVPTDYAFSVSQSYFEDLTYLEVNTYVGVTTILT